MQPTSQDPDKSQTSTTTDKAEGFRNTIREEVEKEAQGSTIPDAYLHEVLAETIKTQVDAAVMVERQEKKSRDTSTPTVAERARAGEALSWLLSSDRVVQDAEKEEKKKRFRAVLAIVFLAYLLAQFFYFGWKLGSNQGEVPFAQQLLEINSVVQESALEAVDPSEIRKGAFHGALHALNDKYARYYSPEEFSKLKNELNSKFVGVGIVVKPVDNKLTIIDVVADSPALAAGLKPLDVIDAVDDVKVEGRDLDDVLNEIRGEPDTKVVIDVLRDKEIKTFSIIRKEISRALVFHELVDGDVGVISMYEFTKGAADKIVDSVNELYKQGAKTFVLDLRSNPGGLIDSAQNVASLFLEKNKPIITVVSKDEKTTIKAFSGKANYKDLPFVILVNEASASATELFSSAVQEYNIAPVIGRVTYGKGVIQQIHDLPQGAGMKLTTARYLSAKGKEIDGIGVTPDMETSRNPVEQMDEAIRVARALVGPDGKKVYPFPKDSTVLVPQVDVNGEPDESADKKDNGKADSRSDDKTDDGKADSRSDDKTDDGKADSRSDDKQDDGKSDSRSDDKKDK